MARAVIAHGRYLIAAGRIGIPPRDFSEDVAVEVSLPVVQVAQGEREIGHGRRTVNGSGEPSAGIDDIHRAKRETFIQIGFFPQRRRRENFHRMATIGAFL